MSRTDHPRIWGTHRVLSREPRRAGDKDYWAPRSVKRYRFVESDRMTVAEGLAEIGLDRPRMCWDLGPEYEIECDRVALNLLNGEILADLMRMTPRQRRRLEREGHTNHLRRTA